MTDSTPRLEVLYLEYFICYQFEYQ